MRKLAIVMLVGCGGAPPAMPPPPIPPVTSLPPEVTQLAGTRAPDIQSLLPTGYAVSGDYFPVEKTDDAGCATTICEPRLNFACGPRRRHGPTRDPRSGDPSRRAPAPGSCPRSEAAMQALTCRSGAMEMSCAANFVRYILSRSCAPGLMVPLTTYTAWTSSVLQDLPGGATCAVHGLRSPCSGCLWRQAEHARPHRRPRPTSAGRCRREAGGGTARSGWYRKRSTPSSRG